MSISKILIAGGAIAIQYLVIVATERLENLTLLTRYQEIIDR